MNKLRALGDLSKSVLVGMVGGAAGTLVMSGYWRCLELVGAGKVTKKEDPEPGPLGDIGVWRNKPSVARSR